MAKIWVPAGKIPTKSREFHKVVDDVRHAVFSVVRQRPAANGRFDLTALGSGFFVSSEVFVTCWHVVDGPASPHQAGDQYRLVNNLDGANGVIHEVNGGVGVDIHLYPDQDFAILISRTKKDQAYLPISYEKPKTGLDIGIAGYPLGALIADANGNATLSGFVYRVAKGVVTSVFDTNLDLNNGHPLPGVTLIEVNFMFVPGNSGGPIFDAENGRVVAYVEGFRAPKIMEVQESCTLISVPAGLQQNYLDSVRAIYSFGLTLDRVRQYLEPLGVTL
jgi:S1-C subfamily serine protease